jgi:hypothetical protein
MGGDESGAGYLRIPLLQGGFGAGSLLFLRWKTVTRSRWGVEDGALPERCESGPRASSGLVYGGPWTVRSWAVSGFKQGQILFDFFSGDLLFDAFSVASASTPEEIVRMNRPTNFVNHFSSLGFHVFLLRFCYKSLFWDSNFFQILKFCLDSEKLFIFKIVQIQNCSILNLFRFKFVQFKNCSI